MTADDDDTEPWRPDWTISPGCILRRELKARGVTPGWLAASAGLTGQEVDGILNATAVIDARIAGRLHAALGIQAGFWLAFERHYRLDLARGAKDVSDETPGGD